MSTFNPDYPTSNTAGFLQHTYQTPQQSNLYYYPGSSASPYGIPASNNDSRRNAMNPVNPYGAVNPFNQFGGQQAPAIPESAVQPFASYPPSTPMNAPTQPPMGLNSLVESRRNIPSTNTPTSSNPWATQQTPPQSNPFQTPQPTQQAYGLFDSNYPGFRVDMNSMALYGDNSCGFDKHQSWNNYYTQPRTIPMPNINWNAQQSPQACYNQPLPQYPVPQYPTAQANWKELAEKNWSNSNL